MGGGQGCRDRHASPTPFRALTHSPTARERDIAADRDDHIFEAASLTFTDDCLACRRVGGWVSGKAEAWR